MPIDIPDIALRDITEDDDEFEGMFDGDEPMDAEGDIEQVEEV